MIDYPTFLANAEPEDIRLMNLLSQGHKLTYTDDAEARAVFQRIQRLDTAGFVVRCSHHYERRNGVLHQSFEALIEPAAAVYLADAASERIQLSREPLPVA